MAEQLHGADGVLSDDRIRNTVIENHRRTTAAITATTNSVAAATAEFRRDAKENYQALSAQSKAMESVQTDLVQTQKSLSTIQTQFHGWKKYSDLYRADQWQSQGDEPNYNNYEDVLEKISTTQRSVSSQVAKAQQNLLETSELLKRISSK